MTRPAKYLTVGDGTGIAYRDRLGPHSEPSVLLLHGLAGHLGEWDDLAGRLEASGHRVVSYDARGHGESTRRPPSVSRAVHVEDAVTLLRELDLAPAILVGQSLGGHTAMLLAADHPGLVRSLILVEAGPAGRSAELPGEIAGWLDSWPVPFASLEEATAFLGHEAWARGLEERADGLRPRSSTVTRWSGRWRNWPRTVTGRIGRGSAAPRSSCAARPAP